MSNAALLLVVKYSPHKVGTQLCYLQYLSLSLEQHLGSNEGPVLPCSVRSDRPLAQQHHQHIITQWNLGMRSGYTQ